MKKHFPNTVLLSFGVKESSDQPYIKILNEFLKLKLINLEVIDNDVKENLSTVKEILEKNKIKPSLTQTSLGIGYFLIFKKAQELGIQNIFTGQGPDILLGGYNMYKNIKLSTLNEKIKDDLILLETDKKRDSAMAHHFGINLFNPYLTKEFIDFSLKVPAELKLHKENDLIIEKYLSRKVGESLSFPKVIWSRPKKAFQYSTGVQKIVKKINPFTVI